MELLNSFLGQGVIAQVGEIVLFTNTITIAMPTRGTGVKGRVECTPALRSAGDC